MKKILLASLITSLFTIPSFASGTTQEKATTKAERIAVSPTRSTKKAKIVTTICEGMSRSRK